MSNSKKIDKIRPETLLQLIRVILETSTEFEYIKGIQPFLMSFAGQKYYVYVKNVSSAYFQDRDNTTRAQLPVRPEFDEIKESPYPFIFLGYDADNDVLICWNYHIAKKRLNAANSVSFYSRTYFQEEVKQGEFLRKTLKNGDRPVLFKRRDIVSFFSKIDTFFPISQEEIAYKESDLINTNKIASGSTIKDNSENESQNISFVDYLKKQGKSEFNIRKYLDVLSGVITEFIYVYLSENINDIYQIHDTILLQDWCNKLLMISEFRQKNAADNNILSIALNKYIEYLSEEQMAETGNLIQAPDYKFITNGSHSHDYESTYAKNGKLTHLTRPELIESIQPLIASNRTLAAAQKVGQYYTGRYPNMSLSDWMTLVKRVNTNMSPDIQKEKMKDSKSALLHKKRKEHILKVTMPNGSIIEERVVSRTLVNVIEYAGALRVQGLGIMINNVNLVSNSIVPLYEKSQKPVGDGLYIMTCCDTNKKRRIIEHISTALRLNLVVDKVLIEK